MLDCLNADFDDSTYKDAYELWLNEIAFMMRLAIDSPTVISYVKGSKGNNISWTPTSWYPDEYSVDINGTIATTSPWDSGAILFGADGLATGIYLITFTVSDGLGLTASDTVQVNVTANPNIFAFLEDINSELLLLIGGELIGLLLIVIIFRRIRGESSKPTKKKM